MERLRLLWRPLSLTWMDTPSTLVLVTCNAVIVDMIKSVVRFVHTPKQGVLETKKMLLTQNLHRAEGFCWRNIPMAETGHGLKRYLYHMKWHGRMNCVPVKFHNAAR